jgi:hypothetical protein
MAIQVPCWFRLAFDDLAVRDLAIQLERFLTLVRREDRHPNSTLLVTFFPDARILEMETLSRFVDMSFYQVNQRTTFEREFSGCYLCAPNGSMGGWPLMKELKGGDILFHYCSVARGPSGRGAILGISLVVNIGQHRGTARNVVAVIPGTQCIKYAGQHLSEADFTPILREHCRENYASYFEVHTAPLRKLCLRKLLSRSPQVYLFRIIDELAQSFLRENNIVIDQLKSAAVPA